jgi:hypothetical protein
LNMKRKVSFYFVKNILTKKRIRRTLQLLWIERTGSESNENDRGNRNV